MILLAGNVLANEFLSGKIWSIMAVWKAVPLMPISSMQPSHPACTTRIISHSNLCSYTATSPNWKASLCKSHNEAVLKRAGSWVLSKVLLNSAFKWLSDWWNVLQLNVLFVFICVFCKWSTKVIPTGIFHVALLPCCQLPVLADQSIALERSCSWTACELCRAEKPVVQPLWF